MRRTGVENAAAGDNQQLEKDCKSMVGGEAEAARTSTAWVVVLLGAVVAAHK